MNPPEKITKAEHAEDYLKNFGGEVTQNSGIIPDGETAENNEKKAGDRLRIFKDPAAGISGGVVHTAADTFGSVVHTAADTFGSVVHSAAGTFGSVVHSAEQYLRGCGIADAAADAWFLLEYVTGRSRAFLLAELRTPFPEKWKQPYSGLLEARGSHIPLQYLTGEQEFMGLNFRVTPDVLIPRQDTETLVEEALAWMERRPAAEPYVGIDVQKGNICRPVQACFDGVSAQKENVSGSIHRPGSGGFAGIAAQKKIAGQESSAWLPEEKQPRPYRVLDLCTGSGCIAISLAKLGKTESEIWASDLSAAALAVAAENAEHFDAAVNFVASDLFAAFDPARPFDLIVSNPPYITEREMETLDEEVRLHEPRTALCGGRDGLDFYRSIIRESRTYLRPRGCLMFEIGYAQGQAVTKLLRENGFSEVRVEKDLSGKDRVVSGVLFP